MARRWLPSLLLLVFFGLALSSARGDSPTMDEQNHVARGLAFLRTGDPRLSLEHPPLVNSLSALPLLLQPVNLPTDDWSWQEGEWYRFASLTLWDYNRDAERMIFVSRLPIMFLALGLGALLYRATRTWFGVTAGFLALTLYVFDPNIMAHARYSTTDLGGTAFVFLAAVGLWWAGRRGYRLSHALLAGGAYGLALSAKLSAVVFGPVFALLALLGLLQRWWRSRRPPLAAGLRLALGYPLAALAVVWAVFGFDWGPAVPGGVGIPMPVFWRGLQAILTLSGGGRPAFLLGHTSMEGFPAYFPVAFAVKTPLPTLLFLLVALALFVGQAIGVARERKTMLTPEGGSGLQQRALGIGLFLLVPAVVYCALSIQSALNLGYRHLLPILPFLFAFVAGQVSAWRSQRWPVLVLLTWLALANLVIYPHYLSYFNEVVGPRHGYRVLVDSNTDWGQDLKRLKQWMADHGVERIKLAWFGSALPSYYGIAYDPLPGLPVHFDLWDSPPFDAANPEPGVYAISVSNLQELFRRDEEKTVYAWFRARQPDDRVGYSVLIYEVGRP